jgi:hypothetical protein
MNIIRKAVTTLGGVFLAALLIAALAPKAAHGIAASLVQVANTSANPVPTVAADNPANFPVQAQLCTSDTSNCPNPIFMVPTTTSTGLPVKRLVIENFSGTCSLTPGIRNFLLLLEVPIPGSFDAFTFSFPLVPASPNNSAGSFVLGGTAVRIYANPGDTITMGMFAGISTSGDSAACNTILVGHLETK